MPTQPSSSNGYTPFDQSAEPPATSSPTAAHGHRHGRLMWLMCLPMLVLVGVLLATGAVGVGGLLYALGCLVMMGAMMLWMNHGNRGRS